MKYILLFLLVINPITYIYEVNQLQSEASQAYNNKNFYKTIRHYETLMNDLKIEHAGVYLNLAHAYLSLKDAEKATFYYLQASKNAEQMLRSKALNQLGFLAMLDHKYYEAKDYFQQALMQDPQNDTARFNLELLLKKIKAGLIQLPQQKNSRKQPTKENTSTQASDTQKASSSPTPTPEDQQTMEAQIAQKEGLQSKKLEEIKLNREKAEAILNALKNQEIQYIQQLPRKSNTKNTNSTQIPNW